MSNTTPPHRPHKVMSSRLMTMKFMQRAAASTPSSTPQSQTRSRDTPPSKRQKTQASPPTITSPSDLQLIQAALDDEEEKRDKVIEKLAGEAGETKWILSTVDEQVVDKKPALRVTTAGYSDLDQEAWRPVSIGRRSFGKCNRELEKHQYGTAKDEASSSSEEGSGHNEDEDDENSDDPAGTRDLIRASKEEARKRADTERRALRVKRNAEKVESKSLAEKRRSKEVKLNRLTSISGGGGSANQSTGGKSDRECYSCGEKGHERRDCPRSQGGKRKNEANDGSKLKRSRQSLES